MIHSFTQQHIDFFYQWEKQFRGHKVHKNCISVEPVFYPYYHPHFGKPAKFDDGRVPTVFETVDSYAKKIVSWLNSVENKNDSKVTQPDPEQYTMPLTTYSVYLPNDAKIKVERMQQLLAMFGQCKHPISFEIIAASTIQLQLNCAESDKERLYTQIMGYFPECIIQEKIDLLQNLQQEQNKMSFIDLGLKEEFIRPLKMISENDIDPFIGIFTTLEQLQSDEMAVIQFLFKISEHPWADSIMRSTTNKIGQPFFYHAPEMQISAKQKISSQQFGCIFRLVARSSTKNRADEITKQIADTLIQLSRSNVNRLTTLSNENYPDHSHLTDVLKRTSHRSPMVINSSELQTFVHLPSNAINCSKFINTVKKTKSLPSVCEGHPFILGLNEHNGIVKPVSLSSIQKTRHLVCTGGSGTGKSNLLLGMILEDCRLNIGIAVIDPHGSLIDSVLKYIPPHRMKDVIYFNPSDKDFPLSLNILKAHTEIEKEVLSSDLVAAFKKNSLSWGDSLNSIFANAISAFLYSNKGGTLNDLRKFLIDKEYRNSFLKTVEDPSITFYWQKEFPLMRSASIAAILTRLDGFLRPKIVRNMVAQQVGLDFEYILENKKILLIKLSHGLIGAENSYLLGSLLLSKIYQAALARQAIEERQNFMVYIDEFHHYLTPSILDILSGARKYSLGLILAHQSLSQISESAISDSILANANTRICFRLSENDARKLSDGFTYFTPQDFQNLATGEAIAKVDRPEFSFSLKTKLISGDGNSQEIIDAIIQNSRDKYCVPREQVEQSLLEDLNFNYQPEKNNKETHKKSVPEAKEKDVRKNKTQEGIETSQVTSIQDSKVEATKKTLVNKKEITLHRYLQNLIKRIAESKGYKSTIEASTPNNKGKVDVLLEKDNKTIACEVSVTTDVSWEIHNIQKCLSADYDRILVCMSQKKSITEIKEKILEIFDVVEQSKIEIIESENLYLFFEQLIQENPIIETTQKGYKVKVEYESPGEIDMNKKRINVGKVILNSVNKMKK